MARKTTGSTTTNRSKKTGSSVQPAAVPVSEVPLNGKTAGLVSANLEQEIRHRAYELYLQRRATAGGGQGDQNQDWLVAENEILSRHGRLARHTTA